MTNDLPRKLVLGATFCMVFAITGIAVATTLDAAIDGFGSPGLLIFAIFLYATIGSFIAFAAAMLFGIPVYLLLHRLGQVRLAWLTVAGMLGGILMHVLWLGNPLDDESTELSSFLLKFVMTGGAAGAGFWFGAERFGKSPGPSASA